MPDINTACLADLVQDDITLVACPAPSHKTTLVQHSLFFSFFLNIIFFCSLKCFTQIDQSFGYFNDQAGGVDV